MNIPTKSALIAHFTGWTAHYWSRAGVRQRFTDKR